MAADKCLLKICGSMCDVTDNIELGTLSEKFQFDHEILVEEFALAHTVGKRTIPTGTKPKITATLKQPSSAWFARMLGATAANGLEKQVTETLTLTTHAATITNIGGTKTLQQIFKVINPATRAYYYKVGSNPVNGQSYTLNTTTGVLTFAADEAAVSVIVIYVYIDTAASIGTKLVIPPLAVPAACHLILTYGFLPAEGGPITKFLCVDAANCQPMGTVSLGGDVGSFSKTPLEFAVMNENSGDLVIYWDNDVAQGSW